MAKKPQKRTAVVYCQGGGRAKRRVEGAAGLKDCHQALEAYPEGLLECARGCLGLGSCVSACRLDAIHIGPYGAAEVDADQCVGCGLCVKACPRELIRLTKAGNPIAPRCSNRVAAPVSRKVCTVSCISCGVCEKNCPAGAVSVGEGHAVIDGEKCISCGMCAIKCPRGVIVDSDGIFTVRGV